MAVRQKLLSQKRRQQRFDKLRVKKMRARLAPLQPRRLLRIKTKWLMLKRRVNTWLTCEDFTPAVDLQREIYRVEGREERLRQTRISER